MEGKEVNECLTKADWPIQVRLRSDMLEGGKSQRGREFEETGKKGSIGQERAILKHQQSASQSI